MKYNEAIDMILDGGEAYRKKEGSFRYLFDLEGRMRQKYDYDSDFRLTWPLTKEDFTETDWIVEKDGVVYEDYVGPITKIEKFGICAICLKDDPPFCCEQDEPAEIEENSEQWESIKMPIIADEVNEDWLEKKVLCIMRKHGCNASIGVTFENMKFIQEEGKRYNADCPFCFPQEEPKTTTIPAESVILYSCIHSTYPCEECRQKYEQEKPKEEPREKVTFDDVLYLINGVVGAEIADTMAIFCPNYDEETKGKMRKSSSETLEFWGSQLKQKLEYLVSLQEE